MRNTVLGTALAIVFLSALFAIAHFGPRGVATSQPGTSAADVAARIRPDFTGTEHIGGWTLICSEQQRLGRLAGDGASFGATARPSPPARKNAQMPRCRALVFFGEDRQPLRRMRVAFRVMGENRVASLFVWLPLALDRKQAVRLKLSTGEIDIPVAFCSPALCLAVWSIHKTQEPMLFSTKIAQLSIPATPGKSAFTLTIPTDGLAETVGLIRRLDK